jgi:hypothetical protein
MQAQIEAQSYLYSGRAGETDKRQRLLAPRTDHPAEFVANPQPLGRAVDPTLLMVSLQREGAFFF